MTPLVIKHGGIYSKESLNFFKIRFILLHFSCENFSCAVMLELFRFRESGIILLISNSLKTCSI